MQHLGCVLLVATTAAMPTWCVSAQPTTGSAQHISLHVWDTLGDLPCIIIYNICAQHCQAIPLLSPTHWQSEEPCTTHHFSSWRTTGVSSSYQIVKPPFWPFSHN